MNKVLIILYVLAMALPVGAQTYYVTTILGDGNAGLVDSIGTHAEVNAPYELVSDGGNMIYFCDTYNHAVRKYNKSTGHVTTIAGNGTAGYQDGACAFARFNYPEGIVIKNNLLFIGDNYNHCIRQIDLNANLVSTIAGTGVPGFHDGPADSAQFHNPKFITLDKNGDLYISDYENACIRKLSNGQVTTIAGTPGMSGYVNGPGATAQFSRVADVCMDTITGILYCTDVNNNVIRKIDASYNVTTYVGTGNYAHTDGSAATAELMNPSALDITTNGTIYFTGGAGGDQSIRRIDPSGNVSTVAGVYSSTGFQDGLATSALFHWPYGVTYDHNCAIYIADSFNNRIRRITVPEGPINCAFTDIATATLSEQQITVYPNPSRGNFALELSDSHDPYYFQITNPLGQCIKKGVFNKTRETLDLTQLENGVYLMTISQNSNCIGKKLVVQK